jgi:predicted transcriptional regulator
MRTKNKSAVAIADVNAAWSSFYSATISESEKDLANQGWKTIRTISEEAKMTIAAITCRVETAIRKGLIESKKATIETKQGVREVNLYRPISK